VGAGVALGVGLGVEGGREGVGVGVAVATGVGLGEGVGEGEGQPGLRSVPARKISLELSPEQPRPVTMPSGRWYQFLDGGRPLMNSRRVV
jgi:hypothetical protein